MITPFEMHVVGERGWPEHAIEKRRPVIEFLAVENLAPAPGKERGVTSAAGIAAFKNPIVAGLPNVADRLPGIGATVAVAIRGSSDENSIVRLTAVENRL